LIVIRYLLQPLVAVDLPSQSEHRFSSVTISCGSA